MCSIQKSALILMLALCPALRAQQSAPLNPAPLNAVQLNDTVLRPRIDLNRTVIIPTALQRLQETGRIDNFVRAAAVLRGQPPADLQSPANPFDDAEVYQVICAASYSLITNPDPKLDAALDDIIAKIAAAQEKDGYLFTARTINPAQPPAFAGPERWSLEKTDSYELYDIGWLYKAAAAHFQATHKRTLLDVAVKSANFLDQTFGPGKKSIWPGHAGVESGLVTLAHAAGEDRYTALAKFFIDQRGPDPNSPPPATGARRAGGGGGAARGPIFNQSQARFVDLTEATGNAANALYLYNGAAAIAEPAYLAALDKIHDNITTRKLYLTGGLASATTDGSFNRNYLLPNLAANDQTATAIQFARLNQRLYLLSGDAKYVDLLERIFYNILPASISQDGRRFFDANPLESVGRQQMQRRDTLSTAYSPLLVAPLLTELPIFAYAQRANGIYVNLYAAGDATLNLDNGRTLKLALDSRYPWEGAIKLTVTPDQPAQAALNFRIPGWTVEDAAPGSLYTPAMGMGKPLIESVTLKVNGTPVDIKPVKGYVAVDRSWKAGDVVELYLPMPIKRMKAVEQVADDRGRVALQRGPVVYCAEAADNPKNKVRNLVLPPANLIVANDGTGPLTGMKVIKGQASALTVDEQDKLARVTQDFTAIPYFAWGNRGSGEMLVWIADADSAVVAASTPSLIASARLSASPHPPTPAAPNGPPTNAEACRDGIEPRASSDNSPLSHFDWWPATNGVAEWVQADWASPVTISSTSVYWWDDTGVGECRPPVSWKAIYKDGDAWKPVETADSFGLAKDQYNRVNFKPVTTTGLRLEMVMPTSPTNQRLSVGIQEWKIR